MTSQFNTDSGFESPAVNAKAFDSFIRDIDQRLSTLRVGGVVILETPFPDISRLKTRVAMFESKLSGIGLVTEWETDVQLFGEEYTIQETTARIQSEIDQLKDKIEQLVQETNSGILEFEIRILLPQRDLKSNPANEWDIQYSDGTFIEIPMEVTDLISNKITELNGTITQESTEVERSLESGGLTTITISMSISFN